MQKALPRHQRLRQLAVDYLWQVARARERLYFSIGLPPPASPVCDLLREYGNWDGRYGTESFEAAVVKATRALRRLARAM